ncbi:MAG: 23S rRNA (uracil(1939)-C(5))-methyltransferase RlmD [Desulfuromonadales bacterium]|nr:23S rRNA (uracil(1939)-C(5))-methyltransferase RlmD [Desulfuromonadales bacterium]
MTDIIKELDITALVHGGRGLGRHEGKAVFVPLTMPGDRIVCRIVKAKRRYIEAELVAVVEPSPQRREPPCPFFSSCGGCQWQHLSYQQQVGWKEKIFADLMVRNNIIAGERLKPLVPALHEWGYRNRVQFKCSLDAKGLIIGFYRHASHVVVGIDKCLLLSPPIQTTLEHLRRDLPDAPCSEAVSQIDAACGDDGEVRIILHVQPQGRSQMVSWLRDFAACHQISACIQSGSKQSIEVVHGNRDLTIKIDHPEIALRYGPGGFVQVNPEQNRSMVATMLQLLALDGSENVLDLFCGMGNFSLPLARRVKRVVGIEDYAPSIDSARINAAANHIRNVEFHAADAATIMARYRADDDLDLVVLDPPRTGHYQTACELLKIRPQRILYVSCDPATLVRDLTPLVQNGYEVVSSQAFDLFPQTWHIESMTLLSKIDAG